MSDESITKSIFSLYKIPIILGIIGLIAVSIIAYAAYQPSRDYVTKMIGDFVKSQQDLIMKDYKADLEKAKEQILVLESQVAINDKKIATVRKKVGIIEDDIANTPLPTGPEDIRQRFNKLGYPPVN